MPNGSIVYVQGSATALAPLGDGLLCVGGTTVRLAAHTTVLGYASYPAAGELPVSVKGAAFPGATRHYQVWFRDLAAHCTPAQWNLSNALSITWAP
jgi:hypothetical protein